MKLVTPFDPTVGTTGYINTNGINAGEQIVLYNDSLIGLALTFSDGSSDILPASWAKDYIVKNTPMGRVKWDFYNTISLINYPISLVYGSLYEPGEHVASVNTPIPRSFSVGNTSAVPTTGGTGGVATSIVNDGGTLDLLIVEAKPTGDSTSAVTLSNSGHLVLGDAFSPGRFTLTGSIGSVTIDTTGQVEIDNRLLVNLIKAVTGNDLTLDVETAHKIAFQINNTDVVQLTASGLAVLSGASSKITLGTLTGTGIADLLLNAATGQKVSLTINNVEVAKFDATNGLTMAASQNINSTGTANLTNISSVGIANFAQIMCPLVDIDNTGTGANPRFYANSTDGSMILQLPNGTDVLRFEVDGSITCLGATNNLLAGLGSKGVKRSAFDDTGADTYFKAPSHVIFQIPNGTTILTISAAGLQISSPGTTSNLVMPDGSKFSGIHQFTASSGVATNHGCNKTPQGITAVPNGGATTQGVTALTSTQITIATGSAVSSYVTCTTFN